MVKVLMIIVVLGVERLIFRFGRRMSDSMLRWSVALLWERMELKGRRRMRLVQRRSRRSFLIS